MTKRVIDYLPKFVSELRVQLRADEIRWGDEWLERPREGQEKRIFMRFADYYGNFLLRHEPIPWLKVAGNALIGWIREKFPEDLKE